MRPEGLILVLNILVTAKALLIKMKQMLMSQLLKVGGMSFSVGLKLLLITVQARTVHSSYGNGKDSFPNSNWKVC